MSQTYRRLGEGMPDPANPMGGRFHSELRQVKQWVDALPRANAAATQQELDNALDNLSAQRLSGSARFAVLEELRPVTMESVNLLERQYQGSSLPLPPEKARAARQAERFHFLLGHGYRKAAVEICAPSGAVPFLKSNAVAQALARAAFHYARSLALAWRVYAAPASGTWQGLHRVHRFAAELKLDTKPSEDRFAGAPVEVSRSYIETLLMAITNPLAFSQSEQDTLWTLAREYAPRSPLCLQLPEDNAPVVPEDADRGPGPGAGDEAHSLWLDIRHFSAAVNEALQRANGSEAELVPQRGMAVRLDVDVLRRLKRAFGLAAARSYKRLPASHMIDTVVGLSAVHFHAAEERDFDTFLRHAAKHEVHTVDRAAWAQGGADVQRIPRIKAKVLDQSLGGYRMLWPNANQVRARVGELVGLSLSEGDEWMLGVVRWLRYESDGGLSAGVELISRAVAAVALKQGNTENGNAQLIRALEIRNGADESDRCFVAPTQLDNAAARFEVIHDAAHFSHDHENLQRDLLAGTDVLINAGDYLVFRSLREDLITDATHEQVSA